MLQDNAGQGFVLIATCGFCCCVLVLVLGSARSSTKDEQKHAAISTKPVIFLSFVVECVTAWTLCSSCRSDGEV